MKILYMCVFFLDMLVISLLAFRLFQGIDDGSPVWRQGLRGGGLLLAIVLLVGCIRRYVRGRVNS